MSGSGRRWLWVYAYAVGELGVAELLLQPLLERCPELGLLFIVGKGNYHSAYQARFPLCETWNIDPCGTSEIERMAVQCPPAALLIIEMPCFLWEAPCRFPFSVVERAKAAGAFVAVINGWLYEAQPSCRMDRLEKRWFGKAYLRHVDRFLVQNDNVRNRLLAAGVDLARIAVTGNIKFDAGAMVTTGTASNVPTRVSAALKKLGSVVIVAGSVQDIDEQTLVLDAFMELLATYPEAVLIVAPRYPEQHERRICLEAMLAQRRLIYVYRSTESSEWPARTQVIVLDTMGELRDCYAIASVAYVGRNHSVLEPLLFAKPVFVTGGWQARYPSYPVNRCLVDSGIVIETETAIALCEAWTDALASPSAERGALVDCALAELAGARARTLEILFNCGPFAEIGHA
ncbi:MAG: glycosyltransferase N-terminal domain-containing protein [Rhodoferax sp.]|uniref:3-deoxy-D-manno-octulosonic acid transferase n=1 Tax=Rhodoferax sp. TaxID=50421 RepID=UPI002720026F|nr:glycosyltransferase N-terminal domain-containing protein [Rhodoferax sp.]MDO8450883.1 glycosyltransferase N-terminal domain-containing protein [Rhodoferax sp.]